MADDPGGGNPKATFGGISRALSSPNFAWYCGGMALSLTGSFVFFTAIGWLTWELTGSTAWVGTIVVAETLPNVIVGPLAGVLIDRWSAKWALFWAQFLAAIVMTMLSIASFGGWITVELLALFAVTIGILNSVAFPAHFAILPKLVPREDLSPAVAVQTSVSQGARFVGPAVAGGLLALGGAGLAFAFKALSYSGFLIALLFIKIDETQNKPTTRGSMGRELLEGFQYTWSNVRLRHLMFIAIALGIFLRPVIELMPAFVGSALNSDSSTLATFLAAAGAGAMIASLWFARRGRAQGFAQIMSLNFAATTIILSVFLFTQDILIGAVLLVLYGICSSAVLITNQTLLQINIEDQMRARVLSLYALTLRAIPALGAFIVGQIAEFSGLISTILGVTALGAAYWLWITLSPRTRELHQVIERDNADK
jgi:predicted MFS family arabinose efflux permease